VAAPPSWSWGRPPAGSDDHYYAYASLCPRPGDFDYAVYALPSPWRLGAYASSYVPSPDDLVEKQWGAARPCGGDEEAAWLVAGLALGVSCRVVSERGARLYIHEEMAGVLIWKRKSAGRGCCCHGCVYCELLSVVAS
jgi:hypothetical protein